MYHVTLLFPSYRWLLLPLLLSMLCLLPGLFVLLIPPLSCTVNRSDNSIPCSIILRLIQILCRNPMIVETCETMPIVSSISCCWASRMVPTSPFVVSMKAYAIAYYRTSNLAFSSMLILLDTIVPYDSKSRSRFLF